MSCLRPDLSPATAYTRHGCRCADCAGWSAARATRYRRARGVGPSAATAEQLAAERDAEAIDALLELLAR